MVSPLRAWALFFRVQGGRGRRLCALVMVGAVAVGALVGGKPGAGEAQAAQRRFVPIVARGIPVRPLNPRFGIAVASGDPGGVANALGRSAAGSWVSFGPPSAAGPEGRVQLLRSGPRALPAGEEATIQAAARARPGSYWKIGNEPNVPGQDWDQGKDLAANAAEYAATYERYRRIVFAADPTARFVVGNTLNLDATCVGCVDYAAGRGFLTAFWDAYRAAYGTDPPVDVWGIHAYRIDWQRLPMVDTAEPTRELDALRAFVDALPGQRGKPIWLTEFGVIWGYQAYCWEGERVSNCGSPYADDAVDAYLTGMLDWLSANADRLRIDRWFLYTNFATAEPYATVYAGINLLNGPGPEAELTRFGRTYEARARFVR